MEKPGRLHLTAAGSALVLAAMWHSTSDVSGVFRLAAFFYLVCYLAYVIVAILAPEPQAEHVGATPDGLWDPEIDRKTPARKEVTQRRRPLLRITQSGRAVVVSFEDFRSMDLEHVYESDNLAPLLALAGREDWDVAILAFQGLDFWLPCSFEARLVALHRRAEVSGRVLKLCNISPTVQEQFRMNGLARLFHVVPTLHDALRGD